MCSQCTEASHVPAVIQTQSRLHWIIFSLPENAKNGKKISNSLVFRLVERTSCSNCCWFSSVTHMHSTEFVSTVIRHLFPILKYIISVHTPYNRILDTLHFFRFLSLYVARDRVLCSTFSHWNASLSSVELGIFIVGPYRTSTVDRLSCDGYMNHDGFPTCNKIWRRLIPPFIQASDVKTKGGMPYASCLTLLLLYHCSTMLHLHPPRNTTCE